MKTNCNIVGYFGRNCACHFCDIVFQGYWPFRSQLCYFPWVFGVASNHTFNAMAGKRASIMAFLQIVRFSFEGFKNPRIPAHSSSRISFSNRVL